MKEKNSRSKPFPCNPGGLLLVIAMLCGRAALADSVAPPASDNSVESELKSFKLPDGFQVSLFASEKNGIANPVTMRWDPQGRLWVLCTWAYPQKKPAAKPDDKLLILTDTDGDGQADKTETYLDGLNMPMGFAFGDGGVYLTEGTRLLHFRDTNNDGKADARRVVFTGFGTGDTHQNINSLTWSPGGELIFGQGNRCYSRVETAHGIVEANSGTLWRYRPREKRLEIFMQGNMMSVNPWGYFFNRWGEMFAKCNDPPLVYAQPGMIKTGHFLDLWRGPQSCAISKSRSKSMVVEGIENSHFPDDYQGQLLIAGYFVHNIDRFKLVQEGAGYTTERLPDLLSTTHRSFRPVDIKTGPDGAIYIADWYNPIIGHYQADLHHPSRDKTHGRIWRVTAKGRALLKPPVLVGQPIPVLLDHLKSKELYVRRQVKRMLFQAKTDPLIAALDKWVAGLEQEDADYEHYLYEAIGLYESHETVRLDLLKQMLTARQPGARAYATRVVGRWSRQLENPLALLEQSVQDHNPRVRMEAVVACAAIREPRSMAVAVQAIDFPRDRFMNCALIQATHSLNELWEPALLAGELQFKQSSHLAYVLQTAGGKNAVPLARAMLAKAQLPVNAQAALLRMVAELGGPQDLRFALTQADKKAALLKEVLPAVEYAWRIRGQRPEGDLSTTVMRVIENDALSPELHAQAYRLGEVWKLKEVWQAAGKCAASTSVPAGTRAAAISAMFAIDADKASGLADTLLDQDDPTGQTYGAVIAGLLRHDKKTATTKGGSQLAAAVNEAQALAITVPFLEAEDGAKQLAQALQGIPLTAEVKSAILEQLALRSITDPALIQLLTSASAVTFKTPEHSAAFVQALAKQSRETGDKERGRIVFRSRALGCISCHESESLDEQIGPDLSAIGAGMPLDRIVESVLWPGREIKEGYESTTIVTDRGRVHSGYVRKEADGVIRLFDVANRKLISIPSNSVEERTAGLSPMPKKLVDILTRQQLCDLMSYLSTRTSKE